MKKIDMHVHSLYSGDNDTNPEDTIITAIERGLNGVVFTEHDTYLDSDVYDVLVNKYRDKLMIFRAMELSTENSHTLIYGADLTDVTKRKYSRYSSGGAAVQEVVAIAGDRGGIAIPAHPYKWGLGDKLEGIPILALEGINGNSKPLDNQLAIALAGRLNINFIAGSDSHDPETVGRVFTEFDDSVIDESSLIKALIRGEYKAMISRIYEEVWGADGYELTNGI